MAHSKKIVWLPLMCILFMGLGLVFQADNALAQGKKSAQAKPQSVDSRGIWLERAKKNTDFMRGKASWYGNGFHTGATASGVPYDMYTFTAAHRTLPFGTIVRVTDQHNGKSVMVCVTDRGPFVKGRIIDMSYAAADRIGLDNKGVSTVNLEVVSDEKGKPLDAAQAFFVELDSAAGAERYGPYDNFADAAALQQGLYLLQNVGKQQVLHPLDQHGDGGRRLHLQMPCVGVGLKAVLLHHRKHPCFGLFAHVRMVVEHPGHGAEPVPGQPGNICDRHVPLRAPRGEGQPFTAPATTPLMIYFCANR